MLSPESPIIDYQIVPASDVMHYLENGFVLYGSPFDSSNETHTFYQALIKTRATANKITTTKSFSQSILSEIELYCVTLLAEGKTVDEIAIASNRSTRHVRKILVALRSRFNCRTNTQLILQLERQEFLNAT